MITEIGIVAGEIWHYLDQHGQVSLSKILSETGQPRDLALMSMGWLSREGHIIVTSENGDYQVTLRKSEG